MSNIDTEFKQKNRCQCLTRTEEKNMRKRIAMVLLGLSLAVGTPAATNIAEVRAVPGHTDDQVAIAVRVLLGGEQGVAVDDVELEMPQLQVAPRADDAHDFLRALLARHALGRQLDVQKTGGAVDHAVVFGMVVRQQNGGRAVVVGAVRRRGTVSQGEPGNAAVRGSGDDLAERHVRGDRHIADVDVNAAIPAALFGFDLRKPVDVLGDAVGIGIVVAVAGRVLQHFLNRLIPHEVGVHRVEHLTHGQPLFLKDELLDRGEGVHHGRVAEEFEVRIIDAAFDLLGMQILHVLHAEVVQHGGQRSREMLRAQTVDDVLLLESLLQQIDVLRLVGIVEFLPRLEAGRIAGFKADKLVAVVVQAAVARPLR